MYIHMYTGCQFCSCHCKTGQPTLQINHGSFVIWFLVGSGPYYASVPIMSPSRHGSGSGQRTNEAHIGPGPGPRELLAQGLGDRSSLGPGPGPTMSLIGSMDPSPTRVRSVSSWARTHNTYVHQVVNVCHKTLGYITYTYTYAHIIYMQNSCIHILHCIALHCDSTEHIYIYILIYV